MERTIKVIKGIGPELSTEQLERASAQLLLARIRGHEPQVSFTFIQRMLDELIRRRDVEAKEATEPAPLLLEMEDESCETLGTADFLDDSADLLEVPTDETSFDFDGLDLEALESSVSEPEEEEPEDVEEEELEEEEEEEEEEPEVYALRASPRRMRAPVLACSRPSNRGLWTGEVNVWRVLVLSFLIFFAMICGVFLIGCGSKGNGATFPASASDLAREEQ